ncbi:hypothetical protein [Gordonia sp. NB41Y]|nr:hypothetical protein [Gordonia sp. NB41Y]EMP13918.2 hypothetical protein ISGA_212 [Gordonia sp. NB41Y]WLP88680.1 hypothetical protein Q9K23_13750 [Gordonia sp. NB41Y]
MRDTDPDLPLGGGQTSLRPEIASSWFRSRLSGVDPSAPPSLDWEAGVPAGSLASAADDVVRTVARDLRDVGAGVLLADSFARVVDIGADDSSVAAWMASLGAVPGARFGEDNAGTNAIGTPIEIRRCVSVLGEEHFHDDFKEFSCHGRPVYHPITRRTIGVVNICFRRESDNPLFSAIARRAVDDITSVILERSPRKEQLLAAAFSSTQFRHSHARIALGDNSVIATPEALDLLGSKDHAAVRAMADDILRGFSATDELTLESGLAVDVGWTAVDGAGLIACLSPRVTDETAGGGQLPYRCGLARRPRG